MYIDRYGEDTVAWLIYTYGIGGEDSQCGNAAAAEGFLNYVARKSNAVGDDQYDTNEILKTIYGEDDGTCIISEYDVEVFTSIINGKKIVYDRRKDNSNVAVTKETVNFASTMLEAASANAPDSAWTMNSMGDVNTYRTRILISDSPDIESGIYSEVIRNDGTTTLTGFKEVVDEKTGEKKIVFNSYGIDGKYQGIDVQISPTIRLDSYSGMAAIDITGKVGIYVHTDSAISQNIPKTDGVAGAGGSGPEIDTMVKYLAYIENEDGSIQYIGSGKDNFYTAFFNDGGKSLEAQVYGNGAVYTKGVSIQGAEIVFSSGYLKAQNGGFVASDNLKWSFGSWSNGANAAKHAETYVKNYIVPKYESAGLSFNAIVNRKDGEDIGEIVGFDFLADKECNVNPFDHLAVMNNIHNEDNTEVGFGVRFNVNMDDSTSGIADVSGVADLKTSGVTTIHLFSEELPSGAYIEDFRVSGVSSEATVTTTLHDGFVWSSGDDPTKPIITDVNIGDRLSLGAVCTSNNTGVVALGTVSTYGPNGEIINLSGATFTGDKDGHFVLANDVMLGNNGITYVNVSGENNEFVDTFVIKDIMGGSVVQFDDNNNLNVLSGKSHIDAVVQGSVLDNRAGEGGSNLASSSSALFEGLLNETKDGSFTTVNDGTITGWKTSTMGQDFSIDTIKREGSTWVVGSYIDGHYVKENAQVNKYGVIDDKYYQKTTAEIVTGAIVAAATVVVAVVAAVATFGAAVPVIAAAAVAAAVLIAPSAFEHGAALAGSIETAIRKDDWSLSTVGNIALNAGLIALDFISAFTLGASIGAAAASIAATEGAKLSFGAVLNQGIKQFLSGSVNLASIKYTGRFANVATKVANFLSKTSGLTKLALGITKFGTLSFYGNIVKGYGQKAIMNASFIDDDIKVSVANCFGQAIDMAIMLASFSSGGGALNFSKIGAAILGGFVVGGGIDIAIQLHNNGGNFGDIKWLEVVGAGALGATIVGSVVAINAKGLPNTLNSIKDVVIKNKAIFIGMAVFGGGDAAVQGILIATGNKDGGFDWGEFVTWTVFGAFVGSSIHNFNL